ncbi:hypothetical protein XENOCAPTIV_003110 [Xenoophorus captivus]|uniref:Uncharacterized protein n=1 Tax=Xenoophorus captivus TaxID=1517983 RepID=A0ABV0SDR2_9TELE
MIALAGRCGVSDTFIRGVMNTPQCVKCLSVGTAAQDGGNSALCCCWVQPSNAYSFPRTHTSSCCGLHFVVDCADVALPVQKPQRSVCFHVNSQKFHILLLLYEYKFFINRNMTEESSLLNLEELYSVEHFEKLERIVSMYVDIVAQLSKPFKCLIAATDCMRLLHEWSPPLSSLVLVELQAEEDWDHQAALTEFFHKLPQPHPQLQSIFLLFASNPVQKGPADDPIPVSEGPIDTSNIVLKVPGEVSSSPITTTPSFRR